MIRLSQTMIVKNEEKNIESALSWGKDIASEQIVVDTGSVDDTVKKAEAMGAKVVYFQWIDDFSAAKNFAIEQCIGDWILILDADEFFVPEDVAKLRKIIEIADKNGYAAIKSSLTSINIHGDIISKTTQVRIIKNLKQLRYKRRIHEILTYPGSLNVYDATKELNIIHTGYADEIVKEKHASKRNRNLLLKELSEHPKDSEILGYLADDFAIDDREKAIQLYNKAIENMPENIDSIDTRCSDTFTKLIITLGLEDKEKQIIETLMLAEKKMPQNGDFSYYTGLFFYNKEKYQEAFKYYQEAFEKLEQYGSDSNSENLFGDLLLAYAQFGNILYECHNLKGAVSIESSVLKKDKKNYLALVTLLKALKAGKTTAEMVIGFLNKIYSFEISLDKLLIYKASNEADYKDLSDRMYDILDKSEKEML